ncbi:fibronectin type III domain-containing protein [Mariniflexile ostreae]|uniref:Fibronectin type III domain-containing protein n=1 Tax=Mariniflexile ostreae TaxID=1520892 RepID=A0ABV5FB31_9FLAO
MKLYKLHITLIITLIWSSLSMAQTPVNDSIPSIKILARVQQNKILLRWAVNEGVAWKKSNTNGFILEKYLFSKDGQRLPEPQKLWEKPIKADALETWETIIENNDFAAIIAQALYGDSFLVEGSQGQLADIINLVEENEQRFTFALMAADMNFEAATKAGWGYTDTEVKPNEQYAYKIKSALPQELLGLNSSVTIAGLKNFEPLPAPIDLQGMFNDKHVLITWEYDLFKSIYTSYNLERSEDGTNFSSLSKEPLVNLNDKPNAPAKRMYYIDSLAQNNKTYYYRVNGISPFGEKGNYSEIISGQGEPGLSYTPYISDFKFTKKPNEAEIFWEYPTAGEVITKKFQLNHAEQDSGPYKVVVDSIPVSQRSITYSALEASNYFTITAVGVTPKHQKTSFSTLIQPIDSIPPAIPKGLEGIIDSLGTARIKWTPNADKDILGYRIFRGFTKNEEPSQITVSPIEMNTYIDTVEIKNLNAKVYYQVVAVDKRFNHSQKSEVLVLEKPDVIPPTAPIFSNYTSENGTVTLHWIPTTEPDATHVLMRKNLSDTTEWEVVYKSTDTTQQFTDTKVEDNKTYRYTIKAIDKSGLESPPSTPLTISVTNLMPKETIKSVNFNVNRIDNYIELFWRADTENIAEFTIYKQVKDQQTSTWRIVNATTKTIIDQDVHPNQVYIYHFRATETNGKFSKVKTVEVKF